MNITWNETKKNKRKEVSTQVKQWTSNITGWDTAYGEKILPQLNRVVATLQGNPKKIHNDYLQLPTQKKKNEKNGSDSNCNWNTFECSLHFYRVSFSKYLVLQCFIFMPGMVFLYFWCCVNIYSIVLFFTVMVHWIWLHYVPAVNAFFVFNHCKPYTIYHFDNVDEDEHSTKKENWFNNENETQVRYLHNMDSIFIIIHYRDNVAATSTSTTMAKNNNEIPNPQSIACIFNSSDSRQLTWTKI